MSLNLGAEIAIADLTIERDNLRKQRDAERVRAAVAEAKLRGSTELMLRADALLKDVAARLDGSRADYAACAEAIGVVDEAEGQGSQPGPRDAVVSAIREAVRDAGRYHEAEGLVFELKEKLAVYEAATAIEFDGSRAFSRSLGLGRVSDR